MKASYVGVLGWMCGLSLALNPGAHATERVIKLKSGFKNMRATQALFEKDGVKVLGSIPQINAILVDRDPPARSLSSEWVESSRDLGRVRTQDMGLGTYSEPPALSPASGGEWNMDQVNASEAWSITTGSKDVIAAISDTGAWTHPELTPNFWQNPGEAGVDESGRKKYKNKRDDEGNGYADDWNGWNCRNDKPDTVDRHYHGTHVSGTVGAYKKPGSGGSPIGISWQVSLMEVPFIDESGSGSDFDGAKTIVYAADNGARVLNASWGSDSPSQVIQDAIEYAKTKGLLVVVAAGNDGRNTDSNPSYPASYDSENIISVAATGPGSELTYFSNWGTQTVDLAAPGDEIYSTWNPMNSPLRRYWHYRISGTSMAAPHVTGAAALLFAVNPALSWRQAKEILLSTATPRDQLQGRIKTGGELNVGEAVKRARALLN